jgi:energy-coupling factor transporter ATP-binding protein EcfA2
MDFYQIRTKEVEGGKRKGELELYPDFTIGRSRDLMIRGRGFYAIWDEEQGLWSQDEYDVQRLVDEDLKRYAEEARQRDGISYNIKDLRSFSSNIWNQFRKYIGNISDNAHQLDENLTFANTLVKKSDYVSRRLPYSLEAGDHSAWDELVGTLYNLEERAKIEWAIGSVIAGDSKKIQKFLVLYGAAGTGKSTILNIVQKLFVGYTTTFEAKALGGQNNSFATEAFKNNPLVAIQHDGDLSKIEDNTKLNSIISHEEMTMNEKYKASYTSKVNAFLFMGTNQPVKISDAKSGIIRRLIDVHPTGVKIPINHYLTLMAKIDFELGAIAQHCLEVYQALGKNHYNAYRPVEMMFQTDVFFNFIEANYDVFKGQDAISLKQAYGLYKEFCLDTGIPPNHNLPQYKVREELRNYFDEFKERDIIDGTPARSVYRGFNANKFKQPAKEPNTFSLVIDETESIFDSEFGDLPAQPAKEDGTPKQFWSRVRTTLSEINTHELHYVKVPEQHIVIDFDLKDINGHKALERNLEAASTWPATYAEISKSGSGVHLHYLYDGDVTRLSPIFSDGIEVKVYRGDASLRRLLTKCNSVPIATINSGLPLKEKKVLHTQTIQSEKGLRDLIAKNLRKEVHPGTKPSIDFIHKILEEAYASGMIYDVTDLRSKIMAFANNSTNQPLVCLKTVQKMKFASEQQPTKDPALDFLKDSRRVFYDVEVYPNLFVICWKFEDDPNVISMINPSAAEVEALFKLLLIGFNCRRYDNHILYAAFLGYNNQQLFELSQRLINNDKTAGFGEAYNLSYTDIWDFSSKKQGLKKFEIELGIHHMELDLPWEEPVADEDIPRVVEYCCNDVVAEEVVFKARMQDFVARQILAELSGLSVNDTTQKHTAKIIFGDDRNPQRSFVYTDLSKEFPGYEFDRGKSTYMGETTGEGGYVYAEPGMYENVAVLDIASMHPTTIKVLNLFGDEYTRKFAQLIDARLAIKHRDFDAARDMLNGKLAPFLNEEDEASADALAYALKIVINIVYGLTSAKFPNPFRDPRNIDNIVAKRGALFMIELKKACQEKGLSVAHIKTDSIKIPDATQDDIDEIIAFGEKFGYTFEFEGTLEKFCLVNDAVYIARKEGKWDAVGAQFQHPYVFKKLFSKEEITFDDLCETKSVIQGVMYLDFEAMEKPAVLSTGHMQHVGRTGRFVPVLENGGVLYRVKDDKLYAVTGTKGYLWVEAEVAKTMKNLKIDMSYFENLASEAVEAIDMYGPFTHFVK